MMRNLIFLTVALLAAGVTTDVNACRTPVYRYAMFNWPVAPYYVFYLHHGAVDAADKALHDKLEAVAGGQDGVPVNLTLVAVDASDAKEVEKLPKEVVAAWREVDNGKTPVHLVYSSVGAKVHVGRLDADAVAALLDSPARKKLGELFTAGNGVVWIVLEGSDAEANAAAKKAVAGIVEECRTGKLVSPADEPELDMPADEKTEGASDRKVRKSDLIPTAMFTVSRDDKAETWFVRSLLAIPPALADEAEETTTNDDAQKPNDKKEMYPANRPLVFAVYGRGRAMEPYTGKHIARDNLADCLLFLAGPCSCMIKDQNPGCDLLLRWDWDETATAAQTKVDEQLAAEGNAEMGGTADAQPAMSSSPETKPGDGPRAAQPEETATGTSTNPAKAATGEAASRDVAADQTPDFARRQSSQFVIILLAGGGVVFLLGTGLWYWRRS